MTLSRSAFVGGAAAAAALAPRVADAQIYVASSTIGVAGPLSGDNRRAGEQLNDGVRQAIDDYNRQKSSFDRGFLLRAFDDQNSLAGALVAAEFAINDPSVIAVIGHLGQAPTIGTERRYAESNMPLVVPVSSSDGITEQAQTKLVRLATRDSDEGRLHAIRALADDKPTTVVTLVQDGDYGNDVGRAFAGYLDEKKVTSKIVVFGIDKPNYKGAAAAAIAEKPDLIFLAGRAHDMGPIAPILTSLGYAGRFRGSQGFFEAEASTYGLDGMTVSTSMPPLAFAPSDFQILNDFSSRYGPMTPLNAFGYASAQIVIAAVKRATAVQRLQVLTAMQSPSTPFSTVVGQFTFNGRGDAFDPNLYFYKLDNGRFVYSRAAHPSTFLIR